MECRVFSNFAEYWFYAKHLTKKQRAAIDRSLPKAHRDIIDKSYQEEGWPDLFLRNQLDVLVDEIDKEFGFNLVQLRCLVLSGKSVFVKRKFWKYVNEKFGAYSKPEMARHIFYIFGGYRAVEVEGGRDEYKLVPVEKR